MIIPTRDSLIPLLIQDKKINNSSEETRPYTEYFK